MYHVNAEHWVDLEILEDLNIEKKAEFPFLVLVLIALRKWLKYLKMVKIVNMVSDPVVTAVESNWIWLIKLSG